MSFYCIPGTGVLDMTSNNLRELVLLSQFYIWDGLKVISKKGGFRTQTGICLKLRTGSCHLHRCAQTGPLGSILEACSGVRVGLWSSRRTGLRACVNHSCSAMPWEVSTAEKNELWKGRQGTGSWHYRWMPVNQPPAAWLTGRCWQPQSQAYSPSNL